MGEDQKKESSQFDLGFVIGGRGAKFSYRPILDWGNLQLKTTKIKVDTSWEAEFLPKVT